MIYRTEIEKLKDEAYKNGFMFEKNFRGCGQSLVASVFDTLNINCDEVFKAATGFAGGIGVLGDGCCGTYIGGVLIFATGSIYSWIL